MDPRTAPVPDDIAALLNAGHACSARGSNAEARRQFEQALDASVDAGLPVLQIHALLELVHLDIKQSDVPAAIRNARRCADLARDVEGADPQARALLARATVSVNLGETSEALGLLEAALPHVDASADPWLGFDCRNMMGIVVGELGQPDAAMHWYLDAHTHALRAGREFAAAVALSNATSCWIDIGTAAGAAGHGDEALAAWRRGVQACDEAEASAVAVGCKSARFVALANRAETLALLGRVDAALAGFRDAADVCDSAGDSGAIQMAVLQARLLRSTGKSAEARDVAVAAIDQLRTLGSRKLLDTLHEMVSAIDAERGEFASALRHHQQMFEVYKAVAADQAAQRARVMAVRLETERAVAEATRERQRASQLEAANAALSDQAAASIEEAMQDPLTGLANRRKLDACMARRHADATQRALPLCVALMDVDHFKRINDGHSHAVGDRVLKQVGEILRSQCRGDDLAARYGGEEFVLVFDGVGLSRAAEICERVRRAIADFDWSGVVAGLSVTASIGLCDIAPDPDPATGLVRADALMYEAKAAGRNCVRGGC